MIHVSKVNKPIFRISLKIFLNIGIKFLKNRIFEYRDFGVKSDIGLN